VGSGAQQHAPHEIRSRDTGCPPDHLEAIGGLDEAVAVLAAAVRGDIVAVDDVLAAVVADPIQLGHVRGIGNRLGHPATGIRGEKPLAQGHDGRTLVLENGLVRVHAYIQLITQLAGLDHGTCMA